MFPVLKMLNVGGGGQERKGLTYIEIEDDLAGKYGLSDEEKTRLLKSGRQRVLQNRIYWTTLYLRKAGLVEKSDGAWSITDEGRQILAKNPTEVNLRFLLENCPKYVDWKNKMSVNTDPEPSNSDKSPTEMIESGYVRYRNDVEKDLLDTIKNEKSPKFFEKLIVDLVRKMGYGVEHEVLGKTGDGGIDGVIHEDKLGIDIICLQAKRWKDAVPVSNVRDFAGAMDSKKAKKGIFVTTSEFTKDTHDFVRNISSRVILIDGAKLASFMYDYGVGVRLDHTYEINSIDTQYFSE